MADDRELIRALGDWEGFEVQDLERKPGSPEQIWITLVPKEGEPTCCKACGNPSAQVHEKTWRTVRDLPLFDAETHLKVLTYRIWCDQCDGPKRMRIDWLDERQRVTKRLANSIIHLCQYMPIVRIAEYYGLHWHTVKRIAKRRQQEQLGEVDLSNVRQIGMDEFALHKGQSYATLIMDPTCRRVLWVGKGNGRADIRPFFELLGPDGCTRIEAAVMDMRTAFANEVQAQCPNVEIVYDLFHVVAKYAREVIYRVRVDEANRLRDDPKARKVIKGARWLLLRNADNVPASQQVRLDELLEANQVLMMTYVLRDDLRELWRLTDTEAAAAHWTQWFTRAVESGVRPLVRFAERLKAFLPGLIAHARYPLHTSLLEGMNNRIKVMKRMAYGYRDEEYFFLKIRAAYPG